MSHPLQAIESNPAGHQRALRGTVYGVVSALSYGTAVLFVRYAYKAGMSAATATLLRFALATLCLFLFLRLSGRWVTLPTGQALTLFLCGLLLYTIMGITWFEALRITPAWLVSLLVALFPIPVMIGSWLLLHQQSDSGQIIALGVVLIGVVLLFWRPLGEMALAGVALMVISVTFYAIYLLIGERWAQEADAGMRTVWTTLGAAVGSGVYALGSGQLDLRFAPDGWLWALLLGIVCTVMGIAFLWESVRLLGPTPTAIIAVLEPVFSVLLSVLLLGESLSTLQWSGAAVVLAGIVFLQTRTVQSRPVE